MKALAIVVTAGAVVVAGLYALGVVITVIAASEFYDDS